MRRWIVVIPRLRIPRSSFPAIAGFVSSAPQPVTRLTATNVSYDLNRPVWNANHPPDIEIPMHVFTFRSRAEPDIVGFTTRRTGSNLPEDFAPWDLVSQAAMRAGDPVTGVYGGANKVIAGIDRDGYYVGRLDVRARSVT